MTMIELTVAVSVLALLGSLFLVMGSRLRTQGRIELTQSTITILGTALEQYYEFTHAYPPDVNYTSSTATRDFSRAFDPRYAASVSVDPATADFVHLDQAGYNPYSSESSEVLYYYLNRIPQCRDIMNKLSPDVVSGKASPINSSGVPVWRKKNLSDPNLILDINGSKSNLFRVVDAWQVPLGYTQTRVKIGSTYPPTTNFPVILSAGPDGKFGTSDDLSSKTSN